MRFTIITTKADNQPPQRCCDFYPPGGTIGRGSDNNLVLPDNERAISRLQVIVHINNAGECRITNRGSVTRVVLNDIPLERGRQVELQEGDILGIDDYRIEVTDLILDTQPVSRMAASMQATMSPPSRQVAPPATAAQTATDNIPAAVPTEVWDSLMQTFSISDSISSNRAKSPESQRLSSSNTRDEVAPPVDPLFVFNPDAPLVTPKSLSTDQLFTDEPLFKNESIFNDVISSAPGAWVEREVKAGTAEVKELDSRALPGDGEENRMALKDSDCLLGGIPFHADGRVLEKEAQPESQAIIVDPCAPDATTLFANQAKTPAAEEALDNTRITLPTPQSVPRTDARSSGRLRIDPLESHPAQNSSPTRGNEGDVLKGELLDALLEGMGLGDIQPVPQFDKENMRQFGQMLSMFSQGTVALLSSRSILKRGVKADMTMVLDDANNPFKLLPSGKTVLMQMFGTHMPGFMPPKKSVRDALIDLQAHQLGMIAGIRAIIAAMLQSFNPQQLEDDARRDGSMARLGMLSNRKAALWDYFVRTYAQTAGEIDDDFHTLFGEAFLHAYDTEVNQYKDAQSGSEE